MKVLPNRHNEKWFILFVDLGEISKFLDPAFILILLRLHTYGDL